MVPDPAPRPVRRSFTAAYRLAIVAEYEAAPRGEKGAVLRREGLYHSHIKEWTAARDAGALTGLGDARRSADRFEGVGQGSWRGRAVACPERPPYCPAHPDSDGVGHHGKSTRALGDALREHGHLDPAEEVMTVAFDGLREAGVATRTACTLTGRARASHYRRLRPPTGSAPTDTAVRAQGAHPGVEPSRAGRRPGRAEYRW